MPHTFSRPLLPATVGPPPKKAAAAHQALPSRCFLLVHAEYTVQGMVFHIPEMIDEVCEKSTCQYISH
jgi:hypothetical protein